MGISAGDKDSTPVSPKRGPSSAGVRTRPMLITPNPSQHPQSDTPLALVSREALVSALRPSTGSGDMQGVTLPKAPSPPLPAGVSGPRRRDLAEGLRPVMAPVPGQYLRRGLTMAATTAPSAGKGPPGCQVLWDSRQGC